MAKLIMYQGRPRLFTMEASPIVDGKVKKTLQLREPDDSALGVYMYATLVSEDKKKQHPVFDYFERAKKVRVTFEIVDDAT